MPWSTDACGPPISVTLPCSLAYLAHAIARRMLGVSAPKPITSLLAMASFIPWSFMMRSSASSTGNPFLLQARAQVGDPEDHGQRILLDVGLDVGQ